ncbi:MAG: hypothetical protein F9K44_15980 [Hyphomicrobiaceae bacterium]|nr:MAG: hypothetical protein F9K44_15980 [Hyphomicrobiaceae bacterium]
MPVTLRASAASIAALLVAQTALMAQSDPAHRNPAVKECQLSVNRLATLRQSKRLAMEERSRVDGLIVSMELQCVAGQLDKASQTAISIREALTK